MRPTNTPRNRTSPATYAPSTTTPNRRATNPELRYVRAVSLSENFYRRVSSQHRPPSLRRDGREVHGTNGPACSPGNACHCSGCQRESPVRFFLHASIDRRCDLNTTHHDRNRREDRPRCSGRPGNTIPESDDVDPLARIPVNKRTRDVASACHTGAELYQHR